MEPIATKATHEHNPQNFKHDLIGKGYNFLTAAAIAFLSDKGNPIEQRAELYNTLQPESFDERKGTWSFKEHNEGEVPEVSEDRTWRSNYRPTAPDADLVEKQENILEPSAVRDFLNGFSYLATVHNLRMIEKGFWQDRNDIVAACSEKSAKLAQAAVRAVDMQALALITTETSETVEALRHGNEADDKIPEHCGAAAELADIVLRIMDLSHARGWDVPSALVAKMVMNNSREKMHGKLC